MTTNLRDSKDPAESVVLGFDFSSDLSSIDSVAVSISVYSGTDLAVAGVLSGAPQIAGAIVYHRVAGGVAGVRYKVRAVATKGDDVIVRSGIFAVATE